MLLSLTLLVLLHVCFMFGFEVWKQWLNKLFLIPFTLIKETPLDLSQQLTMGLLIVRGFKATSCLASMMSSLCCIVCMVFLIGQMGCIGQSSAMNIFSNCSEETILPKGNLTDLISVHVVFNNDTVQANCSWILPRPDKDDDRIGNTLFMDTSSVPGPLCQEGDITVYDALDLKGTSSSGVSMCSGEQSIGSFDGRPGFPTLVTLTLRAVTKRKLSLFLYQSLAWTGSQCPENYLRLNATLEKRTVSVGNSIYSDYLPNGLSCSWEISSSDQGIVMITMSGGDDVSNCIESSNYFLIRDNKGSANPVTYKLCKNGVDVRYASPTGSVFLELHTATTGGQSPNFDIDYRSQDVCSQDMALNTVYSQVQVFKGASDPNTHSTCSWIFTTEHHLHVVMLTKLDNREFLKDCSEDDYLSVGEDGRKISLCDNSSLPVWSQGHTMHLTLHHQPRKSRRNFFVSFTEVDKVNACQDHTKTYKAASESFWRSTGFYEITDSLSYISSSCQWNFESTSDELALQVRVSIQEGESSARHDCSLWMDKFLVHKTSKTQTSDSAALTPTCSLDFSHVQLVFTSSAASLTLEYPLGHVNPEPTFDVDYTLNKGAQRTAMSSVVAIVQIILLNFLR